MLIGIIDKFWCISRYEYPLLVRNDSGYLNSNVCFQKPLFAVILSGLSDYPLLVEVQ